MSWIEHWEEGHTPWDAGGVSPELVELVESGDLPEGRALVPGCGSGYDVLALASEKRHATGLDIAPGAEERFETLREESGVSRAWADFVTEDFFEYEPDEPFDLVWDYTFLCAIEPERRSEWTGRMEELIRPGGMLAMLVFPVVKPGTPPVAEDGSGPPYRITPDLVWNLVSDSFTTRELRPARKSHPSREGKEWVARLAREPRED